MFLCVYACLKDKTSGCTIQTQELPQSLSIPVNGLHRLDSLYLLATSANATKIAIIKTKHFTTTKLRPNDKLPKMSI